jgi:hypothetical protein
VKILHIAPFNTAGVPLEFVRAERALGHESRLITLSRSRLNFDEDICLDLPLLDHALIRLAKRLVSPKARTAVSFKADIPAEIPRIWRPNRMEQWLIAFREKWWARPIAQAIRQFHLMDFDVYQLDGGLEFFRDGRILRQLKQQGKKIICCYTGSDLRVRGVIPEIDALSDLNISVEFDHQFLHPNLTHVPFPIIPEKYQSFRQTPPATGHLKISHAPTNRLAKGSDIIIPIVEALAREFPIELVLIEKMPYPQALKMKGASHIFIDQIGDLGYGISGLEALSMGIVTCSCLAPGFAEKYPDHPFVEVSETNLREELIRLITDAEYRQIKGKQGWDWVNRVHHATAVVRRIHELAGL